MNILAIIPARSGSKGIPSKNLALLHGRPLITYSIESAIQSQIFCDVIVSSDSQKILSCSAKTSSQSICINRPSYLATDDATTLDVVKHALKEYLEISGITPDAICLLQPTSPLRNTQEIVDSCIQFQNSTKNSLVSVSPPLQHPSDFIYSDKGQYKYCFGRDGAEVLRRQEFVKSWFINGSIYITDTRFLLKQGLFYALDDFEIFVMSEEASIDIDIPLDICFAEAVLNKRNNK